MDRVIEIVTGARRCGADESHVCLYVRPSLYRFNSPPWPTTVEKPFRPHDRARTYILRRSLDLNRDLWTRASGLHTAHGRHPITLKATWGIRSSPRTGER